jgi:hypothetical protein
MQYITVDRKDFLGKLVEGHQISNDGKEWLTLALDPFHDYNHQIAGYPDADCSQTVVSCYQYQTDVTAPVGAAANWDAHVYTMPICQSSSFDVETMNAAWTGVQQPAATVAVPTGPLNIWTGTQGVNLFPNAPLPATVTTNVLPALGNRDLCSGITRVIGVGFEITNTTSELNKQGAVTTYRMPQLGSTMQIAWQNAAATQVSSVTGEMWREPPQTISDVNVLKGARTWDAKEGVYATCLQNSVHNPLKQYESSALLFEPIAEPTATSTVRLGPFLTVPASAASPNASVMAFLPNQTMPFDTTGAYFTGLSHETTLTIKLKVYVERAPTWADPKLSVLASPSAGYDVRALELYAQAANMLPAAVKVGENAKGDWWRAVLSVLKTAAIPVGMALNPFFPGAGLIGAGVAAGSNLIAAGKRNVSKQVAEGTKLQRVQVAYVPQKPALKKKTKVRK